MLSRAWTSLIGQSVQPPAPSAPLLAVSGMQALNLLDSGWCVQSQDGKHRVLDAALPAQALDLLHRAGLVGDPLTGFNDEDLEWVAAETWVFSRCFDVAADTLARTSVELFLSGIDTVGDVFINDTPVGAATPHVDNVHREYRFEVKPLLRARENEIRIVLQPAVAEAARRAREYPYEVPAMQGPGMFPHMNFLRKPACDFGWDWGPAFAPTGIVGAVQLLAADAPYLAGCNVRQRHLPGGAVELLLDATLHCPHDCAPCRLDISAELLMGGPSKDGRTGGQPTRELHCSGTAICSAPGRSTVHLKMRVEAASFDLWWPHGYGPVPSGRRALYSLSVTAQPRSREGAAAGAAAAGPSSLERHVGFRTIELVRQGANMIPMGVFRSRVTEAEERAMVRDACAAHMNTIRVWGGGAYPTDTFMASCDEAGVLVWLEVMCACALYPRDDAFLATMRVEVRQQAARLSWHPSVCVWGGNNEVEAAFDWFPASRAHAERYAVDFDALFCRAVREELAAVHLDTELPYLDSSPSNGLLCSDPWVKRWGNAQDPSRGDVHFYNYDDDALDHCTYPHAKFVSEFGFQSFPSWHVLESVIGPQDYGWDSAMSNHRQRHPKGNAELVAQLRRHFSLGSALEATERGFRRWIYLTQLQQALVYDTAVCHWRRLKDDPAARTMGVLYWQLNDVWQGPSWSSINLGGAWKLLHHQAQRFFAPLLVSAALDRRAGTVTVHVTSDIVVELEGTLKVEVILWDGARSPAPCASESFQLGALGSTALWTRSLDVLLGGHPASEAFVRLTVTASAEGGPGKPRQTFRSTADVFPVELKDARLRDPRLTVSSFRKVSAAVVELLVSCECTAAFVCLEAPQGGRFSENGFTLTPEAPSRLQFYATDPIEAADLQQRMSVSSLHEGEAEAHAQISFEGG